MSKGSQSKSFHVARTLRVRLDEKGGWLGSVSRSSGEFFLAPEVLALLQEIQRVGTIGPELAARVRKSLETAARTSPDAAEIAGLVDDLHGAGLLASQGSRARKDALLEDGFGDPWIQWAMLADVRRGGAYEAAIGASVNASSVVVDVGAGTGLLSAMALRAGAKKVFAIEETASASRIAPLLKALNLPHARPRFELHQGNSAEAQLPASVTTVVSELFGNDPFCEGVLPTLRDVGARMNKQKGIRWIPQSIEVFVEPCRLLGTPVHERVSALWKARTSDLKADLGVSLIDAFLARAAAELPLSPLSFAVPVRADEIARAGEVRSLGTVRLDPPSHPVVSFSGEVPFTANVRGVSAASPLVALAWFRVRLNDRVTLSNHPCEKDACGHWSPIVLPLAPAAARAAAVPGGASTHFSLSPFEDHLHLEIRGKSQVFGSR